MTPIHRSLALAVVLTLAGCTSKPKPIVTSATSTVDPPLGVRFPERIGAYHLGRSASGFQMHEAHPLYRIEESARWNLFDLGPVVTTSVEPVTTPPILIDETKAELYRQREVSRVMNEEARRLVQSVQQLSGAISAITNLALEQRLLSERLKELENRIPRVTNSPSR